MLQLGYVKIFTCSNIMLSITILLLIGYVPITPVILGVWCEIFISTVFTVWCKTRNTLCELSSVLGCLTTIISKMGLYYSQILNTTAKFD
jgi:hypothetical protein